MVAVGTDWLGQVGLWGGGVASGSLVPLGPRRQRSISCWGAGAEGGVWLWVDESECQGHDPGWPWEGQTACHPLTLAQGVLADWMTRGTCVHARVCMWHCPAHGTPHVAAVAVIVFIILAQSFPNPRD